MITNIVVKNPPHAETDTLLNLYYSGNLLHAEKDRRKLLESYPESSLVFNILGMVFDSQGNSLEAIQNHEKAIQLQPDYADAYNNVGIILSRLGRPEEAVEKF